MIASMTVYKVLRLLEGSYYSTTYPLLPAAYRVEYVFGQSVNAPSGTSLFAFETLEAAATFQAALEAEYGTGLYSIHVAIALEVERLGGNKVMNKILDMPACYARGIVSEMLSRFWAQDALFGLLCVPFTGSILCQSMTVQI